MPPKQLFSQQLAHIIETVELPLPVIARVVQIQRDYPNVRPAEWAWSLVDSEQPALVLAWYAQDIHLYLLRDGHAYLIERSRFITAPECWEQMRRRLDVGR